MLCGSLCAFLLLAVGAQAQPVKPEPLGRCVWAKTPVAVQTEFLTAYRSDMQSAMRVLQRHDAAAVELAKDCSDKSNIPALWSRGAIGAHAIQQGAIQELSSRAITPEQLEKVWRSAPSAALDCVAANAAKAFGIMDRKCPDPNAHVAFFEMLKISPQQDRAAAAQALIYLNARAQEEWAEVLMAKLPQQKT